MVKILIIIFISLCFVTGLNCFAQPGSPPGLDNFPESNTNGQPAKGASTPIDGGAVALLAGGAFILYRKYIANIKDEE